MSENLKVEKPVQLWQHHAHHRRNALAVVRAWISMAAFRDWTMLRHIPKGSKILDVGCGGGRPILAQRGTVTGLEPIAELAETARGIYARVVAGDARALPFADGEFDLALSSHLLFLYSAQLGKDFHLQSMFELCRVAREVRVFPLLALNGGLTLSNTRSIWEAVRGTPSAFVRTPKGRDAELDKARPTKGHSGLGELVLAVGATAVAIWDG